MCYDRRTCQILFIFSEPVGRLNYRRRFEETVKHVRLEPNAMVSKSAVKDLFKTNTKFDDLKITTRNPRKIGNIEIRNADERSE